jgi:hypothetical protein
MAGSCPGRWRRALLLSLALHALALLAVAGLPCRLPRRQTGPCFGPEVEAPQLDGTAEPVCFLAPRARPARRPAPAAPTPQPSPPPTETISVVPTPSPPPVPQAPTAAAASAGATPGGEPSGLPGGRPQGPEGTGGTSFFHIATRAGKVVYVIDCSMSMGLNGALDAAKRELLASLGRLPPAAYFQVIVYNSTARPLLASQRDWLRATPENRQLVAQALRDLQAEGATNHDQALPRALALQPDVIFFLTDADDLTEAYLRSVTQRNRGRTVIHTIELTAGHGSESQMPLQQLARLNGGVYRAVDPTRYH